MNRAWAPSALACDRLGSSAWDTWALLHMLQASSHSCPYYATVARDIGMMALQKWVGARTRLPCGDDTGRWEGERTASSPCGVSRGYAGEKSASSEANCGCRNFSSAVCSICRMRSRLRPNIAPISCRVWGRPESKPYRSCKIRASRSVKLARHAAMSRCSCLVAMSCSGFSCISSGSASSSGCPSSAAA